MRNSSLVEQSWADNERDSSPSPKLRVCEPWGSHAVGERWFSLEAVRKRAVERNQVLMSE